MLYSIFAYDVENSLPLRTSAREAHIARLKLLDEQGRLLLAGPNPMDDPAIDSENLASGFSGSLIVADFDSLETAKAWTQQDPYVAAGVYAKVEVKPFKKVLANPSLLTSN